MKGPLASLARMSSTRPKHPRLTNLLQRLASYQPQGALLVTIVTACAIAIAVSHRPTAITRPQFYAEDGIDWYAQAYAHGPWAALFIPYAGYLNLFSRSVAGLSLLAPIQYAPIIFASAALLAQVLPVTFLATRRLSSAIPSVWTRLVLAGVYLALSGGAHIGAVLTNAPWNLAVLSFMIVVASEPARTWTRGRDIGILGLTGLSGPFALFLAPIALWTASRRRTVWQWCVAGTVCVAAAISGIVLALTAASERVPSVGSNAGNLLTAWEVLGVRVVMSTIIGPREAAHLEVVGGAPLLAIAAAGGAILLLLAWRVAGFEARMFILYGTLVALGSLAAERSVWVLLLGTGGARYWVVPTLSWACVLIVLLARASWDSVRWSAGVLCAIGLIYGIPHSWVYSPMPNTSFNKAAGEFDRASPGTAVRFPEDPAGYAFVLVKH